MNMIAFIGGRQHGQRHHRRAAKERARCGEHHIVVDPGDAQRAKLANEFGVRTLAAADASLAQASMVVWAVKPQFFSAAAAPCAAHVKNALQLSVMAGIRSDAIARASGSERVVRAMPNTPALIGRGISGLYARPSVGAAERAEVDAVLAPTGQTLWVDREEDLDAVTALSGSGPAYVFYFVEAMIAAAQQMGLSAPSKASSSRSRLSPAPPNSRPPPKIRLRLLRERVTSKGGTTYAGAHVARGKRRQGRVHRGVAGRAATGARTRRRIRRLNTALRPAVHAGTR